MKLVIFGLTISSSWGNGHATLWRGLCRALSRAGIESSSSSATCRTTRAPRSARARRAAADALPRLGRKSLPRARGAGRRGRRDGHLLLPGWGGGCRLVLRLRGALRVFYDLDTPVTLARLRGRAGRITSDRAGLRDFDLVLSYTGGAALTSCKRELGARRVAPLYGSVDPDVHRPRRAAPELSRRSLLSRHLCRRPAGGARGASSSSRRGGAGATVRDRRRAVPAGFPWTDNIYFVRHLPPARASRVLSARRG